MEVRMELNDLRRLLSDAAQLGAESYMRMVCPEGDNIKQAEAIRHLKRHGYTRKDLEDWVRFGHVRRVKTGGEGDSSTVWYSMLELNRQIAAINAKRGKISYIVN